MTANYVPEIVGHTLEDDPLSPRTNATVPFRELIPRPDHPMIAGISSHNALSWCESRKEIPPVAWLINRLDVKNLEPFVGFTVDGKVAQGVYPFSEDEGAPVDMMVDAAERLLNLLSVDQLSAVSKHSVDEDEFRIWSNPELYVNPGGLRLDECTFPVQTAVHDLLRVSSSPEGYQKILGCTLINDFLGQLVHGEAVLNAHSYNFRLFGKPHLTEPWGFTFFGHHLALAVLVQGRRMVMGPTFMGAEPDCIDEGLHSGLRLFIHEEVGAWISCSHYPPSCRQRRNLVKVWEGTIYQKVAGIHSTSGILEGHGKTTGSFLLGCPVSLFNSSQKAIVLRLLKIFNVYLPAGPLAARMALLEQHLDQTFFAWIGGFELGDPYYYRIHSPVTFSEFDFHCGIFLANTSPAKCHIHTINRLPNAGDYGKALLRDWEHRKLPRN